MRIWLSALAILSTATSAFADFPPPRIEESDGSPSFVYRKLVVSNDTLTQSGTIATITNTGGSGTVNSGNINAVARYPATGTTVDDSAIMFATSSNVGVGTSTPAAKLNVKGLGNIAIRLDSDSDAAELIVNGIANASNTEIGGLGIYNNTDTVAAMLSFRENANDAADLRFYTQATGGAMTERARIKSSGNIGIGNSAPTQVLDVTGTIRASSNMIIGSNSVCQSDGTNCPSGTGGWTDDGTVVRLSTSTDKVGIGTTAPNGVLELRDTDGVPLFFSDPDVAHGVTLVPSTSIYGGFLQESQDFTEGGLDILGVTDTVDVNGIKLLSIVRDGSTSEAAINLWVASHNGSDTYAQLSGTEIAFEITNLDLGATATNLISLDGDGDMTLPKYVSCGSLTTNGSGLVTCGSSGSGGWNDAGTVVHLSTATDNVGIGTTVPLTKLDVLYESAGTTDSAAILTLTRHTSGTSGVGLGIQTNFSAENASGTDKTIGYWRNAYTDATNAAEYSSFGIGVIRNGSTIEPFGIFGNSGLVWNEPGLSLNAQFKTDTDDNTLYLVGSTNNVGIGTASPISKLTVNGTLIAVSPTTQTIAAGNTVAADACGTIKKINAGGAVTTDTTNTFTAPAAANTDCCMDVINVDDTDSITLDNNANFKSAGAADVVLGPSDSARVCSNGTAWYQVGATGNN